MNFEQVLKLIEAGFTAEEIREMVTGNNSDPETKKDEGKPESEPGKPESEPGKPAGDPDLTRVLKGLQQSINNLDARIRASNMHDEIDDPGVETVDDYLAEIINPTFKDERKK